MADNCFVIMPIADSDGYDKGHFTKVYEDILKPACREAGFDPVRADEVKQTNLIHLDILQKLIESPMAICDLSSRNPNVLFELGLRQAFDKPTVLVQDVGTPKIFDIAPLRYTEYRRELRYREVLEDQVAICTALRATLAASLSGEGVNSIVKILSLSQPATLKEPAGSESTGLLQLVRAEMSEMRSDFQRAMLSLERNSREYVGRGRPQSVTRLTEAGELIAQAELLIEKGAPAEMIVSQLNHAQKLAARYIEQDAPNSIRHEARELFSRAEHLERRLMEQSKRA
jgi:hypothetical protein